MKMKGLFFGMLAFWSLVFVGCSDDVIETDNPNGQGEKVPAYLTVSFSTGGSSSRSTADDANNKGDKHNNQEYSGHVNVGSKAENSIYSALLVVKSTNNEPGYARYYTYTDLQATKHGDEDHYQMAKDIELAAATYDVLVVANPYEALYKNSEDGSLAEYTGLSEGTNDATIVNELYNKILKGQYSGADKNVLGGSWWNFTGNILQTTDGTTTPELKAIMMANKSQCQVELKPNADNVACVDLERVASKITYRPTKTNNLYEVQVPDLTSVAIHTTTSTVGETTTTYNKATLNGTTYWVVWKKGIEGAADTYTYYTYTDDDQTEFTEVADDAKPEGTPKWVYKAGEYNVETWYVRLEQYALVNLSKSVFNVRHTIADATDVPFGTLTGTNFLYTPNWETAIDGWTINDVEFGANGGFKDKANFTTGTWFYNTLDNVSSDSKTGKNTTYFAALPGSYSVTSPDDDVENISGGSGHYDETGEGVDNTPAIGKLLAYCLENTTDIEHQTHGLSTGITFMGKIYSSYTDEENNTPISTLYRYNGYLFQSIADIKKAYNIADDNTDWNLNNDSDAAALAKVGVVKYDGNTCYYYTTEIKHFDNGVYPGDKDKEGNLITQPLGNMEFAIMRNNIYSLSVSNINIIGDPWVDPIPSTPDEVAKPKLEVHAEIMPWIVRYHDIEF